MRIVPLIDPRLTKRDAELVEVSWTTANVCGARRITCSGCAMGRTTAHVSYSPATA